eukprot:m.113864 g.113864  ORF g.113864 m.113864 type:complete len:195 (+) comp13036_c0_seq3:2962-3546(+)
MRHVSPCRHEPHINCRRNSLVHTAEKHRAETSTRQATHADPSWVNVRPVAQVVKGTRVLCQHHTGPGGSAREERLRDDVFIVCCPPVVLSNVFRCGCVIVHRGLTTLIKFERSGVGPRPFWDCRSLDSSTPEAPTVMNENNKPATGKFIHLSISALSEHYDARTTLELKATYPATSTIVLLLMVNNIRMSSAKI